MFVLPTELQVERQTRSRRSMPLSEESISDRNTQANRDAQEAMDTVRNLTPEQLREVARKLYEMLRRDLRIERERAQK
jgi:hypothetical protein